MDTSLLNIDTSHARQLAGYLLQAAEPGSHHDPALASDPESSFGRALARAVGIYGTTHDTVCCTARDHGDSALATIQSIENADDGASHHLEVL